MARQLDFVGCMGSILCCRDHFVFGIGFVPRLLIMTTLLAQEWEGCPDLRRLAQRLQLASWLQIYSARVVVVFEHVLT